MTDKRKFLPAGTELVEKNGTCYKIFRAIAGGGSSIVYEAEQVGNLKIFILKECYPSSTKYSFVRKDEVVCPADENDSDAKNFLEGVKKNIERENETGQIISNRTGRTVAPWGKLNVAKIIIDGKSYEAADSLFIVMERATDDEKMRGIFLKDLLDECAAEPESSSPLRVGGVPAPPVATKILEELLKSLRDIHEAKFIHGDINDANFFLMGHDFKSGDIGVGQLLDFGNARKILDDGKTAPIKDVFSTPGYWSPEILSRTEEGLRLTAATDIYSVGCLMLYLFYGMKYKKARGKDLAVSRRVSLVSVPEAMRHGYRREAAILFREILGKALKFKPEERYQNGAEMLKDILRLKKLTAPPKFFLAPNLFRSPYFVDGSRDKELDQLQREMLGGKHPLFIFGVGGIGKTELANEFARRMIKKGIPAYLVTFKGSMRETVLSMNFSGYEAAAPGTESDYLRRLDILKEDYRGCLLVVDNFDDDEKNISELKKEAAYKDLVEGTGLKILFTTRSRPDEKTEELLSLDEENALKLFTSISPVAPDDEKIVRELLREADCHPMTVELLAKTREDSWQAISYEELLRRLRYRNIDDKNLPAVSIKKNLTEREAKIYGHLKILFDLYKLGEDYRQVICHATLLPLDGFDAATFIANEDDAQKIQLKNLESHSWLRRRKENNLLTIHPLIRSIFKNELRATDEDCADFLKRIWKIIDENYPTDFDFFRQASELFERAANDLPDARGDFAFYAGYCFILLGKFSAAIRYETKAVKIREVALADNPRELARTYNDAGIAVMSSENFGVDTDGGLAAEQGFSALGGDFETCINFLNKARKILESLDGVEDKQNLANVNASLATIFGNREDIENALPLAQKAVEIFNEYPPENLYEKAHAHQALSQILTLKKNYAEALAQKKISSALLEKIFPQTHPIVMNEYSELAAVYLLNNNFAQAEAYILKTIDLLEKVFPETHPDVLKAYRLAASIYSTCGQLETAKKFFNKADEIFLKVQTDIWQKKISYARRMIEAAEEPVDEKILAHNPEVAKKILASRTRDLIRYNREAAEAFRQLKDFDSAEKYIGAATEKISAETEPAEASQTFFTASQILFGQKKFSEALSVGERALKILETITPKNFDKLSEQLIHLGNVCSKLDDHESALKNYRAAFEAQKKNPNPENAVMELAWRSAGQELMSLKRFEEAEKTFEELLEKQLKYFHENHTRVEQVKKLLNRARERK